MRAAMSANAAMAKLDPEIVLRLRRTALGAAARAYAPYSGFRVGAALLLDDGSIVSGCNVENASYGLTCCAERNALFFAICERGACFRVQAVMVVNLNEAASSPCGACRQVLSEFADDDAVVCFPGTEGEQSAAFADLFPHAFKAKGK